MLVEIEVSRVLRAARRMWWAFVLFPLVFGGLGFAIGSMQSPTYDATTQIMVTSQLSGESVLTENDDTATYQTLVTSGPVMDRVILELGLPYTREDLQGMVTASTISGTRIIEIRVTSGDAQESADIANALARNMVTTATDLSMGELDRNLADMTQQADTIRDRITVIDTRLAEIDKPENEENTEVQVEIAQLERERLGLSQTLADLENTIRSLNSSLTTMSIPVIVTDFAKPPETSTGMGRLLLAVLGAFIGGLVAVAWILYTAFTDRVVRDADQVVSGPILERVNQRDLAAGSASSVAILAAKIAGAGRAEAPYRLALVAPREQPGVGALGEQLARLNEGEFADVIPANGVLDKPELLRAVSGADRLVVVAQQGKTTDSDLFEVAEYAALAGKPILGTVLVVE